MSWLAASQSLLAIAIMVAITTLSRAGGLVIMSRVPIGPRVRRFVNAMSSSVLIAVITPMIVHGDGGTRLAAVAAGGTALWLRNPLLGIASGICSASLWRWLV
ncbi:hypothetical protein GCM10007160_36620 [Litchfieldella qijiaojingensis]|uniref:AzlD domain-containing protein n=1 Tax=Litchfieldella qijiaojingensis TaxID=980347 RepID=A0ABQ2Z619_9GAMM|nr:AzlD domain-containing protein [Halomonas qijiaojingensis]GGY05746.1 hypothetical protein GCM10007160_36620 [Halomonas qijiaojingensis]